ncbi:MAG: acyl-CoA dehydratase activase [Candidatus Acetothermia bacterium]|jgi:predicted CoA-substrate-specific enzyme activase|nr:acyl-CoA dehydratase activase [Candidatus Acetothermia bacterium]
MTGDLVGIDIGSLTVKVALVDEGGTVRWEAYQPAHGDPLHTTLSILERLFREHDPSQLRGVGVTGSGGRLLGEILSVQYVNELVAQTRAVQVYHPEVRTVIEIGGQDSKLLILDHQDGRPVLVDFSLNTQCAAGTGSFLEQQAARLGLAIEEFAALAVQAQDPPYIAGRCAVFAKSDIVHLQQVGTPLPEVLGGLCLALARNFLSDVGRGREFRRPILFQGGLSKNQGMVRAFEAVLGLRAGELIVPRHQVLMAAIGAALMAGERDGQPFRWEEERSRLVRAMEEQRRGGPGGHVRLTGATLTAPTGPCTAGATAGYLGIDVGSVSTKAVAIDEEGQLVAKVYLRTRADPLGAARDCLRQLRGDLSGAFRVRGVGVTGSGRELVGRYVRADVVKNEITAQARAAAFIDPEVDTIFEIGGQDSKFIRLEDGVVVDFSLNKACAAGTGSFLEEQAARLGLSIADLIELALAAPEPTRLGERCTVFMESDLIHHQQRGRTKMDLAAGLAYSVAINYLNRVVGDRPIGKRILFQGGVAGNRAVVAALENLVGRPVRVPPHFEVTGALGAALIAKEALT